MSQRKHTNVRILNPHPGGPKYTSAKRAMRYIRTGVARWGQDKCGEYIEFIRDPMELHASRSTAADAAVVRAVDRGYDAASGKFSRRDLKYTYQEDMPHHPYTLKRSVEGGRFEYWPKDTMFAKNRFNPDMIPAPLIESELLVEKAL
jgi:hypothetical protein